MRASARAEVVRRNGRDVLIDARSEPPMAIRRCGERIMMVASAAGPVGGDSLTFSVAVGAGATASFGSAAATMLWPGPTGEESSTSTSLSVGPGATLVWQPEPLVSVIGSRHEATCDVELAATARCVIVEEFALGRSGEPGGELAVELRVMRDGRPLIHHRERFGPDAPGARSAVGTARARHVITMVVVGSPAGSSRTVLVDGASAAWLPRTDDAGIALIVAADRPLALDLLAELEIPTVDGATVRTTSARAARA